MKIIEGVRKNAQTAKWVGVLLIITGILSLAAPLAAGLSVALLVGVLLTVAGASKLIFAFRAGSFGDGMLVFLVGALALVAGLYMLSQPGVALATFTLILAGYFVVSGVFEVMGAFGAKPAPGWGWLLFGGIVSILLGVMIWRQFPVSGVWAVGILVGVRLLMSGMTLMAIAGAAGHAANAAEAALGD